MIDTPDSELGDLGRMIKAWANAQRFPPSQRQIASEIGVSQQTISNWMRGNFARPLKPTQLQSLARMMTGAKQAVDEVQMDALNAMLRDTGLLPKGRLRTDAAPTRKAR